MVPNGDRTRDTRRPLATALIWIVVLVSLIVLFDDPYDPFQFFMLLALFMLGVVFVYSKVAVLPRGRKRLIVVSLILILPALLFLSAYVASHGAGWPSSVYYSSSSTTCQNVKIQNSTSPSGYTYSIECTTSSAVTSLDLIAILSNYAYWIPIVGLILYAMPMWKDGDSLFQKVSRNLTGSALAGALLLPVVGLYSSSTGYPLHLAGWVPFDPYYAFGVNGFGPCSSTNLFMGCVSVDPLLLVVDYLFWLAVPCLVALASSELAHSFIAGRRRGSEGVARTAPRLSVSQKKVNEEVC